ncbi:hypothetical protein B0H63DRAFT_497148 [Podospora didyma]|uniref:Peptidase metallopeptidase domain-containing protein n=1 Tax=Podospora didyma TaxID=330526 RepID=A0AAE0K5B7_9PEZI|nr:hypothetical protein B0H63DRAFT_497148 [Podospora didyma]
MVNFLFLLATCASALAATIPAAGIPTSIKICTQLRLPSELQALADTLAIKENPANAHPVSPAAQNGTFGPALALPIGNMWANNRNLRVKILNGTPKIKQKIRDLSVQWAQYASLTLTFVESGDAEIRVNNDASGGSWSYVGTDNLAIPQTSQTMNFGWFTDSTDDTEFSRVIVHEFGHALGAIHEHQSPAAGIPWNKEAVYAYYLATNNWSRDQVDSNIFFQYQASSTQFSAFDTSSIMLYAIPASLTTNGFSVGWNTALSPTDKVFIGKTYPPQASDISSTFYTYDLRAGSQPGTDHYKRQLFPAPYAAPPSLAVGINYLDFGNDKNPRLTVYADKTTTTSTDIRVDTWSDTHFYAAGATWFRHAANDPDYQSGSWSTEDDHPWSSPQETTSKRITFSRPFASAPPKVVVWLNKIDILGSKNYRVKAFATDISTTAFTLHLDTWSDTTLYRAAASWIAYPASKQGVASGSISTDDIRPSQPPVAANSARLNFASGTFTAAPKVLIALNTIDVGQSQNLRLKTSADGVSKDGFTWHIDGWSNTVVYRGGASYIAFQ